MNFISILVIALGLAMDAFAVSITIGINAPKNERRKLCFLAAIFFGGFQGIMPFIGWAIGRNFTEYIEAVDHWIAFGLLAFIGGKMILEAIKGEGEGEKKNYSLKVMLILAIATSIDALAVGVSFAFLNVNIISSVLTIGIITALLSFVAVRLGEKLEEILSNKAEIFGGLILIVMGVKILIEHLF